MSIVYDPYTVYDPTLYPGPLLAAGAFASTNCNVSTGGRYWWADPGFSATVSEMF